MIQSGLVRDDEITLFRGNNEGPRANQALERWRAAQKTERAPSRDIALRLALVHEFKTSSRIFISTEAGAKGLNLQFCNAVVNWDLPWNPQRIEQRIGRCHRYGQGHDVTVINFIAKDNEAQALTFDILSQKLELFGTVLSASDQVLHRSQGPGGEVLVSALGAEFEAELTRIYERARTVDEVHAELRALREKVAAERRRFEETRSRTVGLIEQRFDDEVRQVFKLRREAVSPSLAALDRDLERLVVSALDARQVPHQVTHEAGLTVIEAEGHSAVVGSLPGRSSLHLGHPLVRAALDEARRPIEAQAISIATRQGLPAKGSVARLRLVKVAFEGFERAEFLLPLLVLNTGERLEVGAAAELLALDMKDSRRPSVRVDESIVDDAQAEALFLFQAQVDDLEHHRFEAGALQTERFMADRLLVLERRRATLLARLEEAERRRDGAIGSEARTDAERAISTAGEELAELDARIERLRVRDDDRYRRSIEHLRARRYSPPSVEIVADVDVSFT